MRIHLHVARRPKRCIERAHEGYRLSLRNAGQREAAVNAKGACRAATSSVVRWSRHNATREQKKPGYVPGETTHQKEQDICRFTRCKRNAQHRAMGE